MFIEELEKEVRKKYNYPEREVFIFKCFHEVFSLLDIIYDNYHYWDNDVERFKMEVELIEKMIDRLKK